MAGLASHSTPPAILQPFSIAPPRANCWPDSPPSGQACVGPPFTLSWLRGPAPHHSSMGQLLIPQVFMGQHVSRPTDGPVGSALRSRNPRVAQPTVSTHAGPGSFTSGPARGLAVAWPGPHEGHCALCSQPCGGRPGRVTMNVPCGKQGWVGGTSASAASLTATPPPSSVQGRAASVSHWHGAVCACVHACACMCVHVDVCARRREPTHARALPCQHPCWRSKAASQGY